MREIVHVQAGECLMRERVGLAKQQQKNMAAPSALLRKDDDDDRPWRRGMCV
jgi:hypothetical protein